MLTVTVRVTEAGVITGETGYTLKCPAPLFALDFCKTASGVGAAFGMRASEENQLTTLWPIRNAQDEIIPAMRFFNICLNAFTNWTSATDPYGNVYWYSSVTWSASNRILPTDFAILYYNGRGEPYEVDLARDLLSHVLAFGTGYGNSFWMYMDGAQQDAAWLSEVGNINLGVLLIRMGGY